MRTIRYHEEVELLPGSERSPGGFRLYSDQAVDRLLLIKQTKVLDFTLEQLRELLSALDELDSPAVTPRRAKDMQEVLVGYKRLTAERIDTLRGRLAAAETFTRRLVSHVWPAIGPVGR